MHLPFYFLLFTFFILVPFDEDDKDASVWFMDHDYLDSMASMFKKVNGNPYSSSMFTIKKCFLLLLLLICDIHIYWFSDF